MQTMDLRIAEFAIEQMEMMTADWQRPLKLLPSSRKWRSAKSAPQPRRKRHPLKIMMAAPIAQSKRSGAQGLALPASKQEMTPELYLKLHRKAYDTADAASTQDLIEHTERAIVATAEAENAVGYKAVRHIFTHKLSRRFDGCVVAEARRRGLQCVEGAVRVFGAQSAVKLSVMAAAPPEAKHRRFSLEVYVVRAATPYFAAADTGWMNRISPLATLDVRGLLRVRVGTRDVTVPVPEPTRTVRIRAYWTDRRLVVVAATGPFEAGRSPKRVAKARILPATQAGRTSSGVAPIGRSP